MAKYNYELAKSLVGKWVAQIEFDGETFRAVWRKAKDVKFARRGRASYACVEVDKPFPDGVSVVSSELLLSSAEAAVKKMKERRDCMDWAYAYNFDSCTPPVKQADVANEVLERILDDLFSNSTEC